MSVNVQQKNMKQFGIPHTKYIPLNELILNSRFSLTSFRLMKFSQVFFYFHEWLF